MKKYILLAALALAAGGIQRSNLAAPPAGGATGGTAGTLPSAAIPATTAGTQTPGSLGSPVTPSGLGTPATPGSLGTPVTPGSLGTPTTPGSLGTPVTPGTIGTASSTLPGNVPVIPGQVNPILSVPGSLTPSGVGNAGALGTTTGSSTGLVTSPTLGGTATVPGGNSPLGPSLLQSESDRDLSAAIRSSLLNNTGTGAVPNAGIGQAGGPATGALSPRALQSIQIDSRGGSITLKGMVPTEADKRAIESRIMLTPGVQSINNQITISPDASRTPSSSVATPRQ